MTTHHTVAKDSILIEKFCVVAISPNSWGRGKNVVEAKKNLVKADGKVKDSQLRMVIGCDDAYIDGMGYLTFTNSNSKSYII